MGLTDEQIAGVIEAHSETVEALKDQRDKYKNDVAEIQKKLDSATATDSEWKKKFDDEHAAFETFKSEKAAEADKAKLRDAYKQMLVKAGVSEKRIDSVLRVSNLDGLEIDDKGVLKEESKLVEKAKTEWADFITSTSTSGAQTQNPPRNAGGKGGTYTSKAEIMAIKDRAARQQAIKDNPALFGYGE